MSIYRLSIKHPDVYAYEEILLEAESTDDAIAAATELQLIKPGSRIVKCIQVGRQGLTESDLHLAPRK